VTQSSPSANITAGAHALATAEAERRPTDPLTERFPDFTLPDAYRVQQANIEARVARGARIIGHKIGLTARAMQELFGVNEPDYGHLLDTMVHDSAQPLDLSEMIDPQVEVEPGFVLSRALSGPDLTVDDVLDATEYVCVCLEIIDSRIVDWRIKVQDTVADNGSSARVIVGAEKVAPRAFSLQDLPTTLELDGVVVERGRTSAILGHPANGVAWLAKALSAFDMKLEAGALVLPGTCTRSRRLAGFKEATGRIEGLGSIRITTCNQPFVRGL